MTIEDGFSAQQHSAHIRFKLQAGYFRIFALVHREERLETAAKPQAIYIDKELDSASRLWRVLGGSYQVSLRRA